jgi:hypothetical protein
VLADLYRDAVPDPMDITKFQWHTILAFMGASAGSVTFSAASRQSPFDTTHGRGGSPMRLVLMTYLALGVVCSFWFLCMMLMTEDR